MLDELLGCVQMVANMLMRDEKPARAEAAEELKAVAAEVQAELTSLRAFKQACEGQEAVAVADGSFNHQCAQGVFLYEHPDPQAAELRMRVAELEAQLATRDQQVAEACAAVLENGSFLSPESIVALAANGAAKAIRSGEWKKHMKGVE